MQVEVYTELLATRPHPQGGEMYDDKKESSWSLQDQIDSRDAGIISSFLHGLADGIDPPIVPTNSYSKANPVPNLTSNMKVIVYDTPRGSNSTILMQIVSRRTGVIAAALRGAAERISKVVVSIGTVVE